MDSISVFDDEGRQLCVGYWFDRLARHLLHAKLLSQSEWLSVKGAYHFDLDHEGLNSYAEFKGSSNMDQLKLFEDQLNSQLEELGFPVERGFVWVFSYNNSFYRNGRRGRLLKANRKSFPDLARFLASATTVSYLIDLRLLAAWRDQNGTRLCLRDKFRDRRLINVRRKDLVDIADNARMRLAMLGLGGEINKWLPVNANTIRPRSIKTELDGNTIEFKLIPLLPMALRVKLTKQLNGQVER